MGDERDQSNQVASELAPPSTVPSTPQAIPNAAPALIPLVFPPPVPANGLLLWVRLDKDRPAIVVRQTNSGHVLIFYGSSQEHPELSARVAVKPTDRAGKVLGLSGITYFLPGNYCLINERSKIIRELKISADLLIEVRKLSLKRQ